MSILLRCTESREMTVKAGLDICLLQIVLADMRTATPLHLGSLGKDLLGNSPAGLDTRYILDVTDHVWAEYYSETMQRWVHLDPCEAAYDTPHLYEVAS